MSDATGRGIERAMRRALELAARGPAWGVNPQVGCVILARNADGSAGDILAEGWHRGAGTPHAEVDALSKLAPDAACGAIAVVTLEPCNHVGRTGPCSEALLAAGVSEVIFGVTDPGRTSGGGASRLRQAGVAVSEGVLAADIERSMRVWLTAVRHGRPFVTAKWASSLDGRAAAADGSSQWITGEAARRRVHEQRELCDAIVVGTGTVIADDPTLTARDDGGGLRAHQPIPVVIGERAIPAGARVLQHPETVVAASSRDLAGVLEELFGRGIRHVFIEGGPMLTSAFVAAGLVDEFLVYLAPVLLGGERTAVGDIGVATIGDAQRLTIDSIERLGDDLLVVAHPLTPHEES